jgi:spore coat protein CotH
MTRRSFAIAATLSVLMLLPDAAGRIAHAQSVDDLFNADTVQEVRLFINSKDLALLRANYNDNTFYPADLLWRDTRVRNVGVRVRGFGSRTPDKPALHVDFDYYTTGQKFLGLKSLVLKNLWLDATMVREKVALGLYSRMGQPVSRESFTRVYINGVYHGLYAIVEDIDASFLTRTLGEGAGAGYLYEYHWNFKWTGADLGDGLDIYKQLFEARTHELEADALLYGPVRDLFREINGPDDAVWETRVGQLIDLKQFVTMVAIEMFLGESDGWTGAFGRANFYLYRPPGTTRYQLIPWDRDHSMSEVIDQSILYRTADDSFFSRVMRVPGLYTHYLDELQRCAESALQEGWFQAEVAKYAALVADAAHEDTHKKATNAEYDDGTNDVMDYARLRPAHVLAEVSKARLAPNPF